MIQGRRTIAVSAGTQDATSHEPKPIVRPDARAISTPIGFADVAVSQSAEETLRLTMPQNIRYAPARRSVPSSGFEPVPWARESTIGKRTPARAVLLGKAGAISASVKKML